jgi:hypothetical protein
MCDVALSQTGDQPSPAKEPEIWAWRSYVSYDGVGESAP